MSFKIYAQIAPSRKEFASGVHVCSSLGAARAAGHTVITHPRGNKYEEVIMPETPTRETMVRTVSVRNHTADELTTIRGVLDRLPEALLARFTAQYTGIVCVDWSGQNWGRSGNPGQSTLLSGGANIERSITRDGITESGLRIELTHAAMYELRGAPYGRRGVFTLWHELGHVAYNNHFTPRTVGREDYGTSIHTGPSEQPAYAFMWYYLNPSRLTQPDREAFARLLGSAGPGASSTGDAAGATTATPSSRIRHSVGQGGHNAMPDVQVVQKLLNRHIPPSTAPLPVTGVCDPLTVNRIRWFQENRVGLRRPDGRVDPGGRTIRTLVE